MITVNVMINGKVIYSRSAVNINKKYGSTSEVNIYHNDDGTKIEHVPDDGAIVLVKKMLDTIKEVK